MQGSLAGILITDIHRNVAIHGGVVRDWGSGGIVGAADVGTSSAVGRRVRRESSTSASRARTVGVGARSHVTG